jgi:cysteinyl-tRNA synthetase
MIDNSRELKNKGMIHRTTIYLTSEHHNLIVEKCLNFSEFVRDKLDEEFSNPKILDNKKKEFERKIAKIASQKSELEEAEEYAEKQITLIKSKLEELNKAEKRKDQLKEALKGLNEKEINFLVETKETYWKEGNGPWLQRFKDFKDIFNRKDMKSIEFAELLKKIKA